MTDHDTELLAFMDESAKPLRDPRSGRASGARSHYVAAAAVTLKGETPAIRSHVRDVASRLGFPMHYSDVGTSRKRLVAEAVTEIPGWEGHAFETRHALERRHHTDRHVRDKILTLAYSELANSRGVGLITLETRATVTRGLTELDDRDHRLLQKLISKRRVPQTLRINHDDKSESLLWIADVLAGARTDFLCGVDRVPYSLLANRVQSERSTAL